MVHLVGMLWASKSTRMSTSRTLPPPRWRGWPWSLQGPAWEMWDALVFYNQIILIRILPMQSFIKSVMQTKDWVEPINASSVFCGLSGQVGASCTYGRGEGTDMTCCFFPLFSPFVQSPWPNNGYSMLYLLGTSLSPARAAGNRARARSTWARTPPCLLNNCLCPRLLYTSLLAYPC